LNINCTKGLKENNLLKTLRAIYFSFPVKLVVTHLRFNHFLLLYWAFLFAIVSGSFGEVIGIPYLFLDPVYMDKVNFWSFIIMGVTLGGFSMAFNISSYILDSFRFPFLGTLPKPFSHFCLNNSLIPLTFLTYYIVRIVKFQRAMESDPIIHTIGDIAGLLTGFGLMIVLMFVYFFRTNNDIFKILGLTTSKEKAKTSANKKNAFKKLRSLRRSKVKVDNYLSIRFRFFSARRFEHVFDRLMILKVFNQNQRNAVLIEVFLFASIISLGLFKSIPTFQIPAAASMVLLLTMVIMFTGAVSFWFRTWAITSIAALYLILNFTHVGGTFRAAYQAYGLDYNVAKAEYSLQSLRKLNSVQQVNADKENMIAILENWKAKFSEAKPKMILVTTSGGGQRAALWTTRVLHSVDSLLKGDLMKHTSLITGASGGLIGASYYRDYYLEKQKRPHDASIAFEPIGMDILNPIIFSLFVNDLFVRTGSFEFANQRYPKDRGYAFEETLKANLGMEDKRLIDFQKDEFESVIPTLVMSPTIVNDGRRLYISAQPVSFFNTGSNIDGIKQQGVDFRALLKDQNADSLRYLSALRMSATFPYITPNVTLPTVPLIEIADAGISDNFGVSDALTFLNTFSDWIQANTSEVILLTIRDSEKEPGIRTVERESIAQRFFSPLQGVYGNWDDVQSIKNEKLYGFLKDVYRGHLSRVEFEYVKDHDETDEMRASLSWRLTAAEKKDIIQTINHSINQHALNKMASRFLQR